VISLGTFVGYLELYLRFVGRAYRIPQMINSIQSGGAAYARLRPLLAPPLPVRGERPYASFQPGVVAGLMRPVTRPMPDRTGPIAVSLRDITFCYPGTTQPALRNVSLDIPAGALVAVTGPVGSGKSALARALIGLYPVSAGRVLFNRHPLDETPASERAARIGYLPQDPYLFSGTVRENILFDVSGDAPDAADGVLRDALHCAALQADLDTFPGGLETPIGEMGIRVSGRQRQRVALARAISHVHPYVPGLLMLDDPFSAVDVDTEAQTIAALRQAFGLAMPSDRRATIVLCSHRLAAFPQADRVVVLNGGEIVEQGTHDELMQTGGLYARIYRAQYQIGHNSLKVRR